MVMGMLHGKLKATVTDFLGQRAYPCISIARGVCWGFL